jgi:hypothetical protein
MTHIEHIAYSLVASGRPWNMIYATHEIRRSSSSIPTVRSVHAHQDTLLTSKISRPHPRTLSRGSAHSPLSAISAPYPRTSLYSDHSLRERIFSPSLAVLPQQLHLLSRHRVLARSHVCQRHRLACLNLRPDRAASRLEVLPTHAPQ